MLSSSSSQRSWIAFQDEDKEKEALEDAKDVFQHGHQSQWLFDHDFKFWWMLYYITLCFLAAIVLHVIDEVSPIDAFFHAVSAMTGAGLSTLPMYRFSKGSFCVMALLMFFGSASFMLLPTIIYRRHRFGVLNAHIDRLRVTRKLPRWQQLTAKEYVVINEYQQLDDALGVLAYLILFYNTISITCGILILHAALQIKPLQIELQQRGFSYLDNAVYLTVSAFANAGCTITSDNLMSMADNPCAYLLLSCLILAGNTALPICLRCLIATSLYVENHLVIFLYPRYGTANPDVVIESKRAKYRRTLQYILDNPRRLTTHLFSNLQTKVLAVMVLFLITLQYIFFLGSTMNRDSARIDHSKAALAGIGYFQTLSVRAAGFTIMDLRLLNQGLLVVYCLMMYIAAFPFVSVLESSVHKSHDHDNKANLMLDDKIGKNGESSKKVEFVNEIQDEQHHLQQPDGELEDDSSQHSSVSGSSRSSRSSSNFGDDTHVNVVAINKKFVTTYFYRHSFFILMALLILAYSEDHMLYDATMNVNLWYIFFEVISAYGNVGLSLGIEGELYSLSGAMTAVGKCTIIFIMLLGKHRGLPNKRDDVIDFQFNRYRAACRYHHHHHTHHREGATNKEDSMAILPRSNSTKLHNRVSSKVNKSPQISQSKANNTRTTRLSWFSTRAAYNSSTRRVTARSSDNQTGYNPLVVKSIQ